MTPSTARVGVIVADDDVDIRSLVVIAVQRAGLELIDELADGNDAWEAIKAFQPELAVLDLSMPGMTGLEVCRLVRADDQVKGMHVLLLTAAVDEASRRAGLEAGADEFLIKPFALRELVERLSILATQIGAPQ